MSLDEIRVIVICIWKMLSTAAASILGLDREGYH